MCELCKNIQDYKIYDGHYSTNDVLVHDSLSDEYDIYSNCEDSFYSGVIIKNISYCPKCGRNLKNKLFETEGELFIGYEKISVSEVIESIKEKVNNDELKVILFLISLYNVYENDPALVQECKKWGEKYYAQLKEKLKENSDENSN